MATLPKNVLVYVKVRQRFLDVVSSLSREASTCVRIEHVYWLISSTFFKADARIHFMCYFVVFDAGVAFYTF